MSDPAETRQETVEAEITALKAKYGAENFNVLALAMLEQCSVSLAIIADNTTPAS